MLSLYFSLSLCRYGHLNVNILQYRTKSEFSFQENRANSTFIAVCHYLLFLPLLTACNWRDEGEVENEGKSHCEVS